MKARIKLVIGIAFAGAAIMAASHSSNLGTHLFSPTSRTQCYSDAEIQLLMKSNHWSKQEAETILRLACQFSHRSKERP